jgi:hypothetical protein
MRCLQAPVIEAVHATLTMKLSILTILLCLQVINGFFFRPKFHVASHISSKHSCSSRMIRLSQNLNDAGDILSELRRKIKKVDADILACELSNTPVAEKMLTTLEISRAALVEQLKKQMRENPGKSLVIVPL